MPSVYVLTYRRAAPMMETVEHTVAVDVGGCSLEALPVTLDAHARVLIVSAHAPRGLTASELSRALETVTVANGCPEPPVGSA